MKKWTCLRSGQCCSVVGTVTMTHQEAQLLQVKAVEMNMALEWAPHTDPRFTRLVGNPACPFLLAGEDTLDGLPACGVHDIRPYNCRRWGCFRVGTDQPYDVASVNRRIAQDRTIRRQAKQLQRKAQEWALKHGWTQDM